MDRSRYRQAISPTGPIRLVPVEPGLLEREGLLEAIEHLRFEQQLRGAVLDTEAVVREVLRRPR